MQVIRNSHAIFSIQSYWLLGTQAVSSKCFPVPQSMFFDSLTSAYVTIARLT